MRLVIVLAASLALSACAGAGSGASPTSSAETPSMEPTASGSNGPSPSLRPGSNQPSRSPRIGDELVGRLGADSIEGGCGYLQGADGTRYQVMYPRGWRLTLSPLQLISPDGEVVARGGDEVTVRGSVANDMASICQIGPIYRATEVLSE